MSDVKLPEGIDTAIRRVEQSAMNVGQVGEHDPMSSTFIDELEEDKSALHREIQAAIVEARSETYADCGSHHICDICHKNSSALRAQAAALRSGGEASRKGETT